MSTAQTRLTDVAIRKAKIKPKPYFLSDGEGLYLRVTPSERRVWVVRKMIGGQTFTKTLGDYPEITLATARQQAETVLNDWGQADGHGVENITLKQAFQEWLNTRKLRARSVAIYNSVFAALGNITDQPLQDITAKQMRAALVKLINEGRPSVAEKAVSLVACAERHALSWGLIETPRLQFMQAALPARVSEHRRSITPDQLPELFKTIAQTPLTPHNETRAPVFALLFYTLLRTSEVVSLQWDFIDGKERCICLPGALMKMGVSHRLPLTESLETVLQALRDHKDSIFVLPHAWDQSKHMSRNFFVELFRTVGILPLICPHGVRSLARSYFAEHNADFAAAEMCLAHRVETQMQRAYQRYDYLEQRRQLMTEWCDYVNACARQYLPNFPLSFS